MAERNDPVPADGDASEALAAEASNSSSGKAFLMILLPALLIGLGGGAWFAFSSYMTVARAATAMGVGFEEEEVEAEKPIEYGFFTEMQNLIINPADSEGRRFLMVNIGLETSKEKTLEELAAKDIVIRDVILKLLGQRTAADLATIEKRAEIKEDLLTAVNTIMNEGKIDRLYFTQYVLQ